MSRTSPRPRRFTRLAAGLAVAAASAAGTLLGATPAYAATPVATSVAAGGFLLIDGTIIGDSVTASLTGGTVKLENLLGPISAGPGCVQQGAVVLCSGITAMRFSGFAGDDTFTNNTSIRSFLSGQSGNDRLTGGSGDDVIDGGRGSDSAFGQGGAADKCTAESESACEI
jgi:hemolysin type calcium-binding protein